MSTRLFARFLIAFLALALLPQVSAAATHALIKPGSVWRDTQGHAIEAHGGGILDYGHTWYWFGTDRNPELSPSKRYVSCYSSQDLVHWKYRGHALVLSDPEHLGAHWVLERPKVYDSPRTHQFVMYMHLDNAHYRYARVGVAESNHITGPYHFVRSFRPLGFESRDIGQFVDDNGKAYLIFESRPSGGFYVVELSPDRLSVEKPATAFFHIPLEGGALVHYRGRYYVMGSHLTGWRPNPNVYASAPKLSGPWTEFRKIAPDSSDTYGSQSTFLLKVTGTKMNSVIFMGDMWQPKALWDSRYLWMPLQIEDGKMTLPAPAPWTINAKTGVTQIYRNHERYELAGASKAVTQGTKASNGRLPRFETASIKPDKLRKPLVAGRLLPGMPVNGLDLTGGNFTANTIVTAMIMNAYGQYMRWLSPTQVLDGPAWIRTDFYKIDAKVSDSIFSGKWKKLSIPQRWNEAMLMLRSLLINRFKLQVRHEKKELPVFELVLAKNGPKIAEDKTADRPCRMGGLGPGKGLGMDVKSCDFSWFVKFLSLYPELRSRVLVDKTGLHGRYSFKLHWTPKMPPGTPNLARGGQRNQGAAPSEPSGPPLLTALQEQLGLRVVSGKATEDVIVIEHIERPTPN